MSRPWWNFEPLAGTEFEPTPVDVQDGMPLQDVEELPGLRMEMPTFAIPGRHALLNDTQVGAIDEVPPLARTPPRIPFG